MGIIGVIALVAATTAAGLTLGFRFVNGGDPKCDICKANLAPMGKDNVLDCPNDFCELGYYG